MYDLFQCVAEAVVEKGLRGLAEVVPGGGFVFDIAKGTWEKYRQRRAIAKMHEDVQFMIMATPEEIKQVAAKIARQVASEEIREQVELFLEQIPAAVQQSLKRADDPTGTSVPANFALQSAEDVVKLLPPSLPRFKRGDALPGRSGWVLDRHISGGGFGEVWLARNVSVGSVRAVKFCKSLQHPDRDLRHEASVIHRLISQGENPNVVPLLDAHLDGEIPWLMYEYVEGGDVGDMIRHWTKLPPAERQQKIVTALQLLAKAVGRFHRLSPPIIHRDLKPANILYDKKQKQLRITDFGIGGIAAREMIDGEKRGTLTSAGRLQSYLYGSYTPLYASTQQKAGEPPDPRDDVHALGVIAYQMLTCQMTQGVGPDFAHDLQELAVEQGLIDLVGRCAAQKAERRPKDAGEIAEVFAKLRAKEQVQSSPAVEPTVTVKDVAAPPLAKALASNTPSPKAPSNIAKNPVAGKPKNKSTTPTTPSNPKPKFDPFHVSEVDLEELGAEIMLDMTPTQASIADKATPAKAIIQTPVKSPIQPAKLVNRAIESAAEHDQFMTNALGMKFAWVPPGTSWLGGGGGKPGTTKFTLHKGLYCGIYPVTQAEWHQVMGTNPSHFSGHPRYPVEKISYNGAQKFLNEMYRRSSDGYSYRLPTEEVWEYICRGGPIDRYQSAYHYYLAGKPSDGLARHEAIFDGNCPTDVGSFCANPLGIYDLHGNVWEWTDSSRGSVQVLRGGSWYGAAFRCSAANRFTSAPGSSGDTIGFRLLASPRGE